MAKDVNTGIIQLGERQFGYRVAYWQNGKKKDTTCKVNPDTGKPWETKTEAARAREKRLYELQNGLTSKTTRHTVKELWGDYWAQGTAGKAYSTLKKQDALWRNHLQSTFGDKEVKELTVQDINDYLSKLYYTCGYTYKYVESFLKQFYLMLGQAYNRNWIDTEQYSRMCLNKGTKISMPPMKRNEDDNIKILEQFEIDTIRTLLKGTNGELAFVLGYEMQLRIGEAYGITWDDVDLIHNQITINKQLQYEDKLWKLVPTKTKNSTRTIEMTTNTKALLLQIQEAMTKANPQILKQNSTTILDTDGCEISSLNLINTTQDGRMQTVNSMKYWSRQIKKLGIDFNYHALRHTGATVLANLNTPAQVLSQRLGHSKIETTFAYYIGINAQSQRLLSERLSQAFGSSSPPCNRR